MTLKLSTGARTAILSAGTSRQGAKTYPLENHAVRDELRSAGLIGPDDGLTRAGTIARERIVDSLMEDL
jgi:hypothetical protein